MTGTLELFIAPRAPGGRFMSRVCIDSNCDGVLVYARAAGFRRAHWHCNGLTHDGEGGELFACTYEVEAND